MKELAFRYDLETDDWVECKTEKFIHDDIEKLPYVILLDFHGYFVQTEKVWLKGSDDCFDWQGVDKGMTILPSGERVNALILKTDATEDYNWRTDISSAIGRWRIYVKDTRITLSADIAKMRMVSNHSNEQMPYVPRIRWHYVSMSIDTDKWESALFPPGLGRNKDIEIEINNKRYEYVPPKVCRTVQAFLQERVNATEGIFPTIMMEKCYEHQLTAFIERPFDLNITFLKSFIGEDAYEVMFPRNQKDNYTPLCQYLDINPPKSMRKAYAINPYSVIIYMLLRQLGFTDINLIRRMFVNDYIFCYSVNDFVYSTEDKKVLAKPANNRISLEVIEEACKKLLVDGNEMFAIKILCDLSGGKWHGWQRDSIEMYVHCYNYLSQQLKLRIAHKGFTETIHDELVEVLNYYGVDIPEVHIISYEPQYLDLECNINGYDISLVHRQSELGKIGKVLHNCVASYANRVGTAHCMIAVVRLGEEYVACIELDKREIIQARGFANNGLDGEVCAVLNYWAKKNNLVDSRNILEIKEDITDYVFNVTKMVHRRTIAEMTLQEFLDLPSEQIEKIKSKYFTLLYEKMKKQVNVIRVAPPPWMQFKDETAYLRYVIPWAERLIRAAENNDEQAVEIIGRLFLEGRYVPKDLKKAEYWFEKDTVEAGIKALKRKFLKCKAVGDREGALLYCTQLLRKRMMKNENC